MNTIKVASLFLTTTLSLGAYADSVKCEGINPGINSVSATVTDNQNGSRQAMHFKLNDIAHPENGAWEFDVNPADIIENTIGYQRLNFVHGHHNTVVKITADADIFGYANANDNESQNAGYRGKLVLWTGPGDNPQRTIFDVVCK